MYRNKSDRGIGLKDIHIVHLNIGTPKKIKSGDKEYTSGVGKQPVSKAFLSSDGFIDDGVELSEVHGGPDRTVLFYSYEHYGKWEKEFGQSLKIPGLGENLTITGLTEKSVCIGDVYKIGDAVIQISQPRNPCSTLSKYNSESRLLTRLIDSGCTGYLGRTLKEGWIFKDSTVTLLERKLHTVTVQFANEIYFHDRENVEGIKKILSVVELSTAWRDTLKKRLLNIE